jgi:hypothetical protein
MTGIAFERNLNHFTIAGPSPDWPSVSLTLGLVVYVLEVSVDLGDSPSSLCWVLVKRARPSPDIAIEMGLAQYERTRGPAGRCKCARQAISPSPPPGTDDFILIL